MYSPIIEFNHQIYRNRYFRTLKNCMHEEKKSDFEFTEVKIQKYNEYRKTA